MINKALMFATACHANQTRKCTNTPYILHPLEAATIVASLSTKDGRVDEELICAAILHDVCEDAYVTYKTLYEMFGYRVANYVQYQSEDKSKTWQERKQHTVDFLNTNKVVDFEIVILGDKLSNMRAINRDYNAIGEELWSRFNVTDKDKHRWYYESIYNSITQIRNTPEYNEYGALIQKVFYS